MKKPTTPFSLVAILVCTSATAPGQAPVIASFSQNGELVCTNLLAWTMATVEWAPTVDGPWTNSWAGLESVMVDSNGTIRVGVPMFYRVRGVPGGSIPNPDPARLVWIPPGTFLMGSPETEAVREYDETQHAVTINLGFWIGKYEVSQQEYQDVIGSNPSYWRNGRQSEADGTGGPVVNELRHPVDSVAWFDATNYCGLLTERERAAGRLPEGYVYRLPTEAEWEYACRTGTTTAFHYGNALRSGMANFRGTYEYPPCPPDNSACYNTSGIYLGRTAEVGSYLPNAWGLYDMHGNVWEWCLDWYGAYPAGAVVDPLGPEWGSDRVFRGGNWLQYAHFARSARRNGYYPTRKSRDCGFRVVLAPDQP